MSELEDALKKQLESLKVDFLRELPTRMQCIEKHFDDCIASKYDLTSSRELHRICHNTAGTCATHQLLTISQSARAIEAVFHPYIESNATSEPPNTTQLRTLIDQLRTDIRQTTAS